MKEFKVAIRQPSMFQISPRAELELSATLYDIRDALERAHIEDGQSDYKVTVLDAKREYLLPLLPENLSLGELDYFAECLEQLDDSQSLCYEAVVKMQKETPDMTRLINLTFNLDNCHIVEAKNDFELGKFYADNDFVPSLESVSDDVYALLDFEKIGRNIRKAENGVFLGSVYVIQTAIESEMQFPYDGNPSKQNTDPAYILRLLCLDSNSPEYDDGDGVWLELPATQEQISQIMEQLHVQSVDDLLVINCDGPIHQMNNEHICQEGVEKLNAFAKRLAEIQTQGELPKYKAVLESDGDRFSAIQLADELHRYLFDPSILSETDYGEREFFAIHHLRPTDQGMDYFDYDGFGTQQMEDNQVQLTPYGIVSAAEMQQELAPAQEPART